MKNWITALSVFGLSASLAVAGESFGGIGVTIYSTSDGVRIVDVIPGSPAAEAGLETNDRILSVDGNSLAGNTLDESKDILRGTVGKPLELSVLREADTLSVTLRRASIFVNEIVRSEVEGWYGENQTDYSSTEIAEVARQSLSANYELLSVMKNGRVIPDSIRVGASELSAVSVEKEKSVQEFSKSKKIVPEAGSLESFDRERVAVDLRTEGPTVIRIVSPNGEVVERLVREDAKAGSLTLDWNGRGAASGRYLVHIEQNGAASAVAAELR